MLPNQATELQINLSEPATVEIRAAIMELKNNKAAGPDNVAAELLKADTATTTNILYPLFKEIWRTEKMPRDWQQGLIVKLPKKGDTADCNNWRGITLLAAVSKVLTCILLRRIQASIDHLLRDNQAGFRKGRSYNDQIFTLRNIIEQCVEWQATAYLNFIHRESLWKILRYNGLPQKIINLVTALYNDFHCKVIHDGALTDSFLVNSGLKQGCLLSPLLFLLSLDWVMKEALAGKRLGIRWTLLTQLEDLDYADDLCLPSKTFQQMKHKTDRLSATSAKIGLNISTKKTKQMRINPVSQMPLRVNNHEIETVSTFTYLGSIMDEKGGIDADVLSRLNKSRGAFASLKPLWRSNVISVKTKLKLFNSNIKTVLLFGSECWKISKEITNKRSVFIHKCL